MTMYLNIVMFMFFTGCLVFSIKRKHLLMMLLSIEVIVLSLFMLMYLYLSFYNYEFYFLMIYLTMSVCEGALGLSLLVSMIRTHGNDYFQMFNVLW
uniref:NADH-ubiquinone oxidoreductase chain 4L n=1 Tax=Enicmus brevicornis TaxID=346775 RepID=S4SUV9_9CUCU|nr:NADH dehydrogenase subunit 4L [Enicmus brevicornis]